MSDVPPVDESLGLLEPEMARCVGKKGAIHPAGQLFLSFFLHLLCLCATLLEPEMARCVGKKAVHSADKETFSSFFSSCLMSMCNRVGYDKSDQEIVWMVGAPEYVT